MGEKKKYSAGSRSRSVVQRARRAWFLCELWTGLSASSGLEYACALVLVLTLFIVMPLWLAWKAIACTAAALVRT